MYVITNEYILNVSPFLRLQKNLFVEIIASSSGYISTVTKKNECVVLIDVNTIKTGRHHYLFDMGRGRRETILIRLHTQKGARGGADLKT